MMKLTQFWPLIGSLAFATALGVRAAEETVTVYKSPHCQCCTHWVAALRDNGFPVETVDTDTRTAVQSEAGVPPALASCHTARVAGYVIEGHVSPADLRRLLRERPDIRGLVVPGMPRGAPGMEGPEPESYDVLSLGRDGRTAVFAHHDAHP